MFFSGKADQANLKDNRIENVLELTKAFTRSL